MRSRLLFSRRRGRPTPCFAARNRRPQHLSLTLRRVPAASRRASSSGASRGPVRTGRGSADARRGARDCARQRRDQNSQNAAPQIQITRRGSRPGSSPRGCPSTRARSGPGCCRAGAATPYTGRGDSVHTPRRLGAQLAATPSAGRANWAIFCKIIIQV